MIVLAPLGKTQERHAKTMFWCQKNVDIFNFTILDDFFQLCPGRQTLDVWGVETSILRSNKTARHHRLKAAKNIWYYPTSLAKNHWYHSLKAGKNIWYHPLKAAENITRWKQPKTFDITHWKQPDVKFDTTRKTRQKIQHPTPKAVESICHHLGDIPPPKKKKVSKKHLTRASPSSLVLKTV